MTAADSKPLDLDRFRGFTPGYCAQADSDLRAAAPALLAECKRPRDEIARLRWHLDAVLNQRESLSLAEGRAPGEVLYVDRVFREARAALRSAGEGA